MNRRTFKKVLSVILIVVLTALAAGCGSGDEGEGGRAGKVNHMTMGTGGVSGTWYSVGGVLCATISKSPNINATAQTAAGGVESIRMVNSGERQLGFAMPSLAIYAEEGIEAFEGTPIDTTRAICAFMPMEAHFIVREGSGIQTIADLKGKTIGTGAPGSGDEVMCREVLEAVGITYKDCKPMLLSFSEQVTAFKDRQLDAMFMLASSPTAAVLDASSQTKVEILSIEGELRDQIVAQYPYYTATTIAVDKYAFLSKDVETIGIPTMLFTNVNESEEVIYELCQYMFDNLETIQASHPSMETFSLETALEGLSVQLHPGAERFYKEQGVR